MSKNIQNLNIPEENKILLSKIERKVPFLSRKSDEYFENAKTVKADRIEEAYSVNKDLVSILKTNDQLTESLIEKSFNIRKTHQTDFTREVELTVTDKLNDYAVIKSTIDQKDKLVGSDDKLTALSRRKKYIELRTKKRKEKMLRSFEILENKIDNENLLDIQPMKEDVELIKKFIDPKEINKTRNLYWIIFAAMALVIILGGLLWIL